SNKATLDAAFAHASGAIVGSRFVELLSQGPTPAAAVEKLFAALR
ncbi:MAG: tryptophan synthase subunit alpha, partial [Prevotellaceae bacterium]|nr:tryptophan synthase subunit alpha [Prevotellaceae bacterium]